MPALKNCAHISKFKREKFSSSLTKLDLECAFPHIDVQKFSQTEKLSICSDCGIIACSHQGAREDTKNSSCIEKHCLSTKHWIQIEVLSHRAYCYKCDVSLNELLVELLADDKLCNNPLTLKLETFLDGIPVIIHNWHQRILKKRPDVLNDNNMLADPYRDDYMDGKLAKNADYFMPANNPNTITEKKPKNIKKHLINFPERIFGLKNDDNTCFMAVILQCLNGNTKIVEYYIEHNEFFGQNVDKMKLSYAYSNFLINSRRSKTNTGVPNDIYLHFQDSGVYVKGEQSDALLFYYCLVDGLMEEQKLVNIVAEKDGGVGQTNFIDKNISSQLLNFTKCLTCDLEKFTYDRQITLSIALDEATEEKNAQGQAVVPGERKPTKKQKRKFKQKGKQDADFVEKPKKEEATVEKGGFSVLEDLNETTFGDEKFNSVLKDWEMEANDNNGYRKIASENIEMPLVKWTKTDVKTDCNNLGKLLELFFGLEVLKENSQFKCEKCLAGYGENPPKVNALRGYLVDGFPDTFVMNLKYYKMQDFDLKKIDTHITFDLDLDMSKYMVRRPETPKKLVYELYAVVVHKGRINGGHYMCYVKHSLEKGEKWLMFNDEIIQEMDSEDVIKKQAYILFYRKKSL